MSSYLFKNARVIDPLAGIDGTRDILVVDGVIESVGPVVTDAHAETFDLRGRIACPGFFDMHVHFREPGYEHKETLASGAHAAAAGGFTGVACMPNTDPPIDSAETVAFILRHAERLPVDIHPIGCVTKDRAGRELAPLAELHAAGAVAFSDDGSPVADARVMRIALEYARMFDAPLIQHAEDRALSEGGAMHEGLISTMTGLPGIPRVAEDVIVARDIALAEYVDGRYHVAHLSTAGAAAAVRRAKERGLKVTCEVTPHHIALTDDAVAGFDTNAKMNPPLRTMDDVVALREALRDGVVDAIATDHAPHAVFEKDVAFVEAPFGIVGLETAIGVCVTELVHAGYLTLHELVEKLSTNPRRILRLPEIRIEPGEAANLTFFDPDAEWTVDVDAFRSKSHNSPFHGHVLRGRPLGIFNREQLVWLA
jgi:dihydroorotase